MKMIDIGRLDASFIICKKRVNKSVECINYEFRASSNGEERAGERCVACSLLPGEILSSLDHFHFVTALLLSLQGVQYDFTGGRTNFIF